MKQIFCFILVFNCVVLSGCNKKSPDSNGPGNDYENSAVEVVAVAPAQKTVIPFKPGYDPATDTYASTGSNVASNTTSASNSSSDKNSESAEYDKWDVL